MGVPFPFEFFFPPPNSLFFSRVTELLRSPHSDNPLERLPDPRQVSRPTFRIRFFGSGSPHPLLYHLCLTHNRFLSFFSCNAERRFCFPRVLFFPKLRPLPSGPFLAKIGGRLRFNSLGGIVLPLFLFPLLEEHWGTSRLVFGFFLRSFYVGIVCWIRLAFFVLFGSPSIPLGEVHVFLLPPLRFVSWHFLSLLYVRGFVLVEPPLRNWVFCVPFSQGFRRDSSPPLRSLTTVEGSFFLYTSFLTHLDPDSLFVSASSFLRCR